MAVPTAAAATPVLTVLVRYRGCSQSQGESLRSSAFPAKHGPTPHVAALIGPSFIIVMRIPSLMCFPSPHVAELLFFLP